jgi:hypothetical protein
MQKDYQVHTVGTRHGGHCFFGLSESDPHWYYYCDCANSRCIATCRLLLTIASLCSSPCSSNVHKRHSNETACLMNGTVMHESIRRRLCSWPAQRDTGTSNHTYLGTPRKKWLFYRSFTWFLYQSDIFAECPLYIHARLREVKRTRGTIRRAARSSWALTHRRKARKRRHTCNPNATNPITRHAPFCKWLRIEIARWNICSFFLFTYFQLLFVSA